MKFLLYRIQFFCILCARRRLIIKIITRGMNIEVLPFFRVHDYNSLIRDKICSYVARILESCTHYGLVDKKSDYRVATIFFNFRKKLLLFLFFILFCVAIYRLQSPRHIKWSKKKMRRIMLSPDVAL